MVTCLPTDPLRMAALAVTLASNDIPVAELREHCITIRLQGHLLPDSSTVIAAARRLETCIDLGHLT